MAMEDRQDGEDEEDIEEEESEEMPMKVTPEMLGVYDDEEDTSYVGDEEDGAGQNAGAEELVELDLGLLLASDGNLVTEDKSNLEAWWKRPATRAIQNLVKELFSREVRKDKDVGPVVDLPEPTTVLPREKPLPKEKPLTRWEQFAQSKGIQKRKRSRMVFDEDSQEWKARYGYKRINDINEIPVIEAKAGDEQYEDPFQRLEQEKKKRVDKNKKSRVKNLKLAAKEGAVPSTLALSTSLQKQSAGDIDYLLESSRLATATPGASGKPKKLSKDSYDQASRIAAVATASMGKFDRMSKGESKRKLPKRPDSKRALSDAGFEIKSTAKALSRVLNRNTGEELNVDKAVRQLQHEQDSSRHKAKKMSGDKTKGKRKPGKSMPMKKQGKPAAVKKSKAGGKGGGKGKRR